MADFRLRGIFRTAWPVVAFMVVAIYVIATLRSPEGVAAVLQKQGEIRKLQQQNADIEQGIRVKRERIRKLNEDSSEQDIVIRERLRLLKQGETTFIIQDQKK
ncbi:MAG: septum formation initiator family protein [Bryobacteraceae bacterium]